MLNLFLPFQIGEQPYGPSINCDLVIDEIGNQKLLI